MKKSCLLTIVSLVLIIMSVFILVVVQSSSFSAMGGRNGSVSTSAPELTPALKPTPTPASRSNHVGNTCNDLSVLVDRTHALPANYVPSDLVYLKDYTIPVTNSSIMGRRIMINELQKLITDSTSAGFNLVVASAYRSYGLQASVYNSYVQDYGYERANTFSAKPGHSQHQLGTAIDFTTAEMGYGLSQVFAGTGAGQWLLANAYKYGFYISYPQGQDSITGYEFEPWHFRYLGLQNVQNLKNSGQIMQTYLEKMAVIPHC